jgi:hypothetical protein
MTQHKKEMHVKTLLHTSLIFQNKLYASKCCAQDVVSSISMTMQYFLRCQDYCNLDKSENASSEMQKTIFFVFSL